MLVFQNEKIAHVELMAHALEIMLLLY